MHADTWGDQLGLTEKRAQLRREKEQQKKHWDDASAVVGVEGVSSWSTSSGLGRAPVAGLRQNPVDPILHIFSGSETHGRQGAAHFQ